MFHIYVIQNLENGMVYIGQTRSPITRKRNHTYALSKGKHQNAHLQRSWNQYGEAAFEFFFLAEFLEKPECDEAECFYIDWYKSLGLAYNNQNGGWGPGKFSQETKEKIRQANLRNGNKPPSRQGVPVTDELREKYRQAAIKRGASPPSSAGNHLPPHTKE